MTYRILRNLGGVRQRTKKVIPAIALMELAIAFGIFAFWAAFFFADVVNIEDPRLKEVYIAFESAFPAADFYLATLLIAGGIGLMKRRFYGVAFSFMGGASLIFLGLLDVSFNVQQGIYSLGLEDAVMNVFINSICIGFGTYLVRSVWKSRSGQTFSHAS
jgi:hypothetical protein